VKLRWEFDLKSVQPELRGSGVIVHSSPERGASVLTHRHVVCNPRNCVDLTEGSEASGPVGGTVLIRIPRNVHAGPLPPAKVGYGRMKALPKASAEEPSKVFAETYLDVALLELKTGREPLRRAPLAAGDPEPGGRGRLRGVDVRKALEEAGHGWLFPSGR
jgi:hypothetical protein